MKRFFSALFCLAIAFACMAKCPVYVWMHGQDDLEKLRSDFNRWKNHGVVGVCVNCGTDLEKIRACSKVAHEVGLE